MPQYLARISLLVRDYDEALAFYVNTLGFQLVEDTPLNDAKRWVVVSPSTSKSCELVLAQASTPEQMEAVGKQAGNRVFLFLYTDDFDAYYTRLLTHGVPIHRQPSIESYGKVAVFADIYGNLWDLIQSSLPAYQQRAS